MRMIVGSYTSMGGPGLALVETLGENMQILAVCDQLKEPIWAEQSRKRPVIYAAAAQGDGTHACVASLLLQGDEMLLQSVQADPGLDNCHLCLNDEETFLYSANYSDGTIAVFPLDTDGKILPCIQFLEHQGPLGPRKDRQEHAHAHQVSFRPGTKELFLCDLGVDQVVIYRAGEDGRLQEMQALACAPGTGPRHLAFDGPDAFYLVGELGGWISRWEYRDGAWQCVQLLSTLPEGYNGPENTAAAVRQDGHHVYVSNRGHDSIAVFPKNQRGLLGRPYFIRTPGAFPRDFVLHGSGFLLAQQHTGNVVFMNENGVPGPSLSIPGAVSILPLNMRL